VEKTETPGRRDSTNLMRKEGRRAVMPDKAPQEVVLYDPEFL
jgi:hypothetical protein